MVYAHPAVHTHHVICANSVVCANSRVYTHPVVHTHQTVYINYLQLGIVGGSQGVPNIGLLLYILNTNPKNIFKLEF